MWIAYERTDFPCVNRNESKHASKFAMLCHSIECHWMECERYRYAREAECETTLRINKFPIYFCSVANLNKFMCIEATASRQSASQPESERERVTSCASWLVHCFRCCVMCGSGCVVADLTAEISPPPIEQFQIEPMWVCGGVCVCSQIHSLHFDAFEMHANTKIRNANRISDKPNRNPIIKIYPKMWWIFDSHIMCIGGQRECILWQVEVVERNNSCG